MALLATRSSGSLFAKLVLATMFFTALTILKTYPLVWHFGTQIPGGPGDPQMVTWILAWNVHSLTTDPLNLFNTNIFYPVQNTLALSEHMIGVAPIFAPAYLLTGNPIIAYNLVLFSAFIFSGLTMFLLVHHWTGNFWGSFLSGCLFAFAPIRFAELGHLQLANFYWAPLALLFLDRFVWSKRWSDMTWFAVFYWLQMLASVYLGWFITIGVAVYVVYHTIYIDRDLLDRAMIPCYVVFIVGSLVVLRPFTSLTTPFSSNGVFQQVCRNVSTGLPIQYSIISVLPIHSTMSTCHLFNLIFLVSSTQSINRCCFPASC
jgi:hypothetical protein